MDLGSYRTHLSRYQTPICSEFKSMVFQDMFFFVQGEKGAIIDTLMFVIRNLCLKQTGKKDLMQF